MDDKPNDGEPRDLAEARGRSSQSVSGPDGPGGRGGGWLVENPGRAKPVLTGGLGPRWGWPMSRRGGFWAVENRMNSWDCFGRAPECWRGPGGCIRALRPGRSTRGHEGVAGGPGVHDATDQASRPGLSAVKAQIQAVLAALPRRNGRRSP